MYIYINTYVFYVYKYIVYVYKCIHKYIYIACIAIIHFRNILIGNALLYQLYSIMFYIDPVMQFIARKKDLRSLFQEWKSIGAPVLALLQYLVHCPLPSKSLASTMSFYSVVL